MKSVMADAAWRWANAAIAVMSLGVLALVAALLLSKTGHAAQQSPSSLASFNAGMNGLTVVCLVAGYWSVRRGQHNAHRSWMLAAVVASLGFLAGYVIHHASVGSVRYSGTWRTLYFAVLIPHVVMAAVEVPLVLLALRYALTSRFDQHRRMARWTLPVWLFVSASGVAVYFLLYWG